MHDEDDEGVYAIKKCKGTVRATVATPSFKNKLGVVARSIEIPYT